MYGIGIGLWDVSVFGSAQRLCTGTLASPIDTTETITGTEVMCSSGVMEIDSVAAGAGIVVINGVWRLT